jgi:hypothetical protein
MNNETLDAIKRDLDAPAVGEAMEIGQLLSVEDARNLALGALAEVAPAGAPDAASE